MQPQWFGPHGSAAQATGQDTPQSAAQNGQFRDSSAGLSTPAQAIIRELVARAETLLKRLCEVEEALADQEWWLMGRAMTEARLLAEIGSLLSVARGELETFLNEMGAQHPQSEDAAQRTQQEDIVDLMGDPMWMSGSREKAIALLRMCAAQMQPMRQYAYVLQVNAERLGLPAVALDPLGIATERLAEAEELLRQPPQG